AALGLLLVTILVGSIAAHSYFNGQPDTENCEMSYSRPQFIEQTKFDRTWTRFADKYTLYLYREGGYDAFEEPFRIPVLFVPGNAGSHKQVRSVASASAAAFVELVGRDPAAVDRGQIGYDYFTVGLNEEFTALHGYSILEQADFINDAIRYILSLYPETRSKHRLSARGVEFALPTSVVVVGHSMGGVVARTAFTLPNHIVGSVQAIFTLSTPHNNPTASLEYYVDKVYSGVNSFWRHGFQNGTLDKVSLVSIAGGNLDSMINSDYTYVGDLAPQKNSLSILSSGINDVWLSVDHQSILWCNQMSKKFANLLMLIMDARQPSQIIALDKRMDIMRRQLFSGLEDDFAVAKPHTARKTTSSSYLFSHDYDSGSILLTPADILMMLPPGERDRPGKSALHLLPIDNTVKNPTVQLLYNPQLLTASESEEDIDAVVPRLVGCNKEKELTRREQHKNSDDDGDSGDMRAVFCETIPVASPARLPMKRYNANPSMPVGVLHYLEASAKPLERFEYLGLELPTRPGPSGFLRASIASAPEQIKVSPGYLRLLRPYNIRIPAANPGALNVRTRIKLDVPENPFFVFRARLSMRRNAASSHVLAAVPRFRPIVRQSDGRRFESKYWFDRPSFDLAIHGRGAYVPSDDIVNLPSTSLSSAGQWDGLDLDIWADPDFYSGFDISLHINWYSSLNRTIKRYDMALLALSFVWACLVMFHQLRTWNSGSASFPSCLTTIERLIRNGTLLVLFVGAVLTPIVQELVAHLMRDVWSPATLATWSNLFMGVRGTGWTLGLVPALLVVLSLGFVAFEAVVLTAMCNLASWTIVKFMARSESRRKHWDRHDVLAAIGEDAGPSRRLLKVPVRPLIATVAFVLFVCTFVPYQFAFLVIYMAQLITAVRTMVHAQLASPRSAATLTPQRLVAAAVLNNRAKYQLGLLLFWTSSLPYCVPELLVWVRNLSVMWFEDAPSDHNLANMAGYFALRLLAAHHIIPRLAFDTDRPLSARARWLRVITSAFFAAAVVCAWLYSVRRPYILYSIANAISAWLALVQFVNFPLRM
ncbi:PGAP1-domain-containing protein, partial [Martensiomyces pterosporus]